MLKKCQIRLPFPLGEGIVAALLNLIFVVLFILPFNDPAEVCFDKPLGVCLAEANA